MKLRILYPIIAMLLVVFVSGCKKDDEPGIRPKVTATNPVNGSTGIAMNTKVSASFSLAMDPPSVTTTTFTLKKAGENVPGVTSYEGTTATFTPTANLDPNTVYTATITTGAKTLLGTVLARSYEWTFTTGASPDVVAPTLTVSNPIDNGTGVALNQPIVLTFSETVDHTTITPLTFTVTQGTTPVPGTITTTSTTATFTPTDNLLPNQLYTVTMTTGVEDVAGNALAANNTVTFTTGSIQDILLPMVILTSPLNNAIGVPINPFISATFSESMNPLTISSSTVSLRHGATPDAGVVSYSGTTARFTPSSNLLLNTTYAVTITTGAQDLVGNSLASNVVWSFTTGTNVASGPAPVGLGAAANYVILAKTAVTNVPTSAVVGHIGLSPAATSYITGFAITNATGYATSAQVTGKIYAADMVAPTSSNLTTAVNNMLTAYTDAAGRPTPNFTNLGTGNIGGLTLVPGLYKWTTGVTAPTNVTISGGANDTWIFQIPGNLTVSNFVNITLTGGAQPKNIVWQVAGTVLLGANSHFEGVILSQTGITFQTNASFIGRALAQTAVILDKNAITKP